MLKPRKMLILLACSCMAAVSLFFRLRSSEKEPSYQGRTLSQWLAQDPRYTPEAEINNAVQKIGTNAIPFLLKWLPFEANPAQRILTHLPEITPGKRMLCGADESVRGFRCVKAFASLGAAATNAIPQLTTLMYSTTSGRIRLLSAVALRGIGEPVVPVLINDLTSKEPERRKIAADILCYFENLARPAIPSLLRALSDPNPEVRQTATNSILQIAPEVLTNAPTQ